MKPFDENGAFRPTTGSGGLRQLAVRGAGVTLLSGGMGLAIQIIATVALARLLSPRDFGLVAMVTTFSLLLANVGENGFPEAVVQREEMDHALASNLFWINVGGGLLLTIGFAAAGSLLARLYHDAEVQLIAAGISLTILLTSTSVLHLALLKRALRFSAVSANSIIARTVSVALSIFFAWIGWGYWALVAGAIALPISQTIGAWLLCRWVPGVPHRVAGTGSTLRFALNTYGRFGVNYFTRNTDNLLVGWRFDARSLGFYKKAYDLFALSASQFVNALTIVVVAALSRVDRNSAQYRRNLLSALTVTAFVGMGLAAELTLVGKDLIGLLLGAGWEPAGRIFTFFGPGIGVMLLYGTHGWIHLSIGRADRWLRWGIVEFAVTFLLFILGLRWGPVGIAVAWTASFWLLTIPAIWYAGKPIGFTVGPVLAVVWRYILAGLFAGCATERLIHKVPPLVAMLGAAGYAGRVATVGLLLGVLYLCAVVILHRGCEPLRQIISLVRDMVPRSRPPQLSSAVAAAGTASSTGLEPSDSLVNI